MISVNIINDWYCEILVDEHSYIIGYEKHDIYRILYLVTKGELRDIYGIKIHD